MVSDLSCLSRLLVEVTVGPSAFIGRAGSGAGKVMRSTQTQQPLVRQCACSRLVAATRDRRRQVDSRRNHASARRRGGR